MDTFQKKFNLSERDLEAAYSLAYEMYNNGKFQDAQYTFTLLVMLNPLDKRFLMGFGAASQFAGDYEKALEGYARAAIIDGTDPYPHFHAAECYVALGNREETLRALVDAENRAHTDQELKDKIEALRQ
jgi:type III secretion system low calcium response chaperone LcrH/SycD